MILSKEIRRQLTLTRRLLPSVESIIFANNSIILGGDRDFVRVDLPFSLMESLSLPSPVYIETGASTIVNLLTSPGEFQVNPYKFVFTSSESNSRTEMKTTITPAREVPPELLSHVTPEFSLSLSDPPKLAQLFKFLHQVSHLNVASSPMRDKFFVEISKDKISFFASNGAIINTFSLPVSFYAAGLERRLILPSKILLGGTGAKKASKKLVIKCYPGVTLIDFDDGNFVAAVPKLNTEYIDLTHAYMYIKKCNHELAVEKPEDLSLPRQLSNRTKIARYIINPGDHLKIVPEEKDFTSNHISNKICELEANPLTVRLRYREFNLSLSSYSSRLILRWPSEDPSFIVLDDGEKISVHATELGAY